MSANNQLTHLMEIMAEATGCLQKMQQCLPALIAAAAAETAAAMPAPKVKKAKKTAVVAPVEAVVEAPVAAPVEAVVEAPVATVVKVKKPASDGTMAWHAFVKHVHETQPMRFADFKKHSQVLHEAKSIREGDKDGYDAFVNQWKAARLAPEIPAAPMMEEVVVVAAPTPVPAMAENKEKRKAAVGTMAWHAFVMYCKTVMPELASIPTSAEKMKAIKVKKDSDKAGYDSFVNEWKAAHPIIA